MSRDGKRWRQNGVGIATLLSAFGIAVTVAALLIGDRPGFIPAIAFAAMFSVPSAIAGWLLARSPIAGPAHMIARPLAAVVVRILPPLAALGLLTTERAGPLRAAGAGSMIVGFYLTMLTTDILLHIALGRQHTKGPSAASSGPHQDP